MAPITNQDELQTLLPSLSPIMSSGADPDDVLTSGDPYGYLSAYRAGVPYQRKDTAAPPPQVSPSMLATAAPMTPAEKPPAPAGTAAIQQGERPPAASPASGLAAGLTAHGSGTPLNPYRNPEEEPPAAALKFNQGWYRPGPYITKLSPAEEAQFQKWASENGVSSEDASDSPTNGYDMRGYWKAVANPSDPYHPMAQKGGNGHYPDRWKTPYSGVFSRESMYALPGAPEWKGDNLYTADGRLVVGAQQTAAEGSQAPATNAPNPPSEATAKPAVPATVTPSGTATAAGPGWSQLARQSAQRAQGTLEDAAQLASQRQPVDVNALEAQRAKLAAPASAENPGGVPNAKDPNHPEYRPSAGRRIARGLLGGLAGLAEGGIRGALLGAIEPGATTGVAYGAPTSRFAADAQRNQQAIDSLDQQLKQADTQAKTRDQAVQDKLAIAAQFAGLTKDEAQALKGDNDRAKIEATVAKAGQKAEWNEDGTLKDIVDDPDSAMFKSRKAMDDLRSAQQEQAEARAALARAQNDPNSPAYKLAKQRADIANSNAAAAQTRADAYMLNAYGANLGTTPQGSALPGATQTTEGAPMGSRFQNQFTKHEGAVAQFNDVGGSLDNLEKAARSMVASGQKPDNSLVAAALAQPEGTATKWIQGQVAKSNLTPEQRDYVINLVSARENLQALRKAGGLPGSTEAQVDRLMEMLPDASTPDLDYFLRQTGQIKQTRERLAAGIPNVVGGTAVETGNKTRGGAKQNGQGSKETRSYQGHNYEKGADGKWHLQQQ